MASTNNFNDLSRPLIVNMGTQNVKYSQPILSTYKLAKQKIINLEKNLENNKNNSQNIENQIINANSIFDNKESMKIIRTLNFIKKEEIDVNESIKVDFSLDDSNETDINSSLNEKDKLKYSFEPFYNGNLLKNGSIESWGKILKKIGKLEYGEDKFENEKYSEIPLIIALDPLPNEEMYKQVSEIYSYCFEKLNASYILICSQAMLNLFGHNLLNGIVVDIGESNTTIIPVKNGFACYDKSVKSNFLSGRTITALMNRIDNENNDYLKFLDYNKYDQIKRDNEVMKFWELNYPNQFIDDDDLNQYQYSHLNYLFSYPELFRCLYRDDFSINNYEIKSSLYDGIQKYDEQRFIVLEDIVKNKKKVNFSEFENELTSFYNKKNKKSLEKILNEYNGNYISREELMKFRQFSLSHRIISKLEDYVNEDSNNGFKYSNIVFAGGVLNTPGLKNIIQKDIESLILNSKVTVNFPLCDDACCSMFKGANYISKLDNLESIMVSKQDYLEIGKDNLCYNYI